MTQRKRWPNSAEWARMDAISAARLAKRELEPLVTSDREFSMIEIVRRCSRAWQRLHEIEVKLNAVGPKGNSNEH